MEKAGELWRKEKRGSMSVELLFFCENDLINTESMSGHVIFHATQFADQV